MGQEVFVWDRFVRIFHWSLVVLLIVSYITGEEESSLHIYSGITIAILILARTIWGVIGSRYARFSDFVAGPKEILQYCSSILSGSPDRYVGHNPLAGVMILLLAGSLLFTSASGLLLYLSDSPNAFEHENHELVYLDSREREDDDHEDEDHEDEDNEWEEDEEGEHDERSEMLEELHEGAVEFVLFLVVLHILGVAFSSWLHHESLIKAMFTGKKTMDNQVSSD